MCTKYSLMYYTHAIRYAHTSKRHLALVGGLSSPSTAPPSESILPTLPTTTPSILPSVTPSILPTTTPSILPSATTLGGDAPSNNNSLLLDGLGLADQLNENKIANGRRRGRSAQCI